MKLGTTHDGSDIETSWIWPSHKFWVWVYVLYGAQSKLNDLWWSIQLVIAKSMRMHISPAKAW